MCDNQLEEFSQIIFEGGDDDTTLTQLIRKNGEDGMKWLRNRGYITAAEASACLNKENESRARGMTSKGVAAIYETFTSALLRNAPYDFEQMFETLPAHVQAGILQAITRDFSMLDDKKLIPDIREAVEVYYILIIFTLLLHICHLFAKLQDISQTFLLMRLAAQPLTSRTASASLPFSSLIPSTQKG